MRGIADFPDAVPTVSAEEIERIEQALRNQATAQYLDGYDVSPDASASAYLVKLWQLIPLSAWERPWVLVLEYDGERFVMPYDALRYAAGQVEPALDYLIAAYADDLRAESWSDEVDSRSVMPLRRWCARSGERALW